MKDGASSWNSSLPPSNNNDNSNDNVYNKDSKRNEMLLDLSFEFTEQRDFRTDELLAHVDAKFEVMEDAGMVGCGWECSA